MTMWNTFENRLVITAQLQAETGLRVGSGGDESAQPTASDLPVLLGADDRPYIPGSSLRGVIRSQIERIVRTLEPAAGNGHGACDPTDESTWCIPNQDMDALRDEMRRRRQQNGQDVDRWFAGEIWNRACRVCRVFGNTWFASRVRIADLPLDQSDLLPTIERRDGVAIHRDKETVQHKYDFETVAAGTTFALRITAENLNPAERGLVWLGLQELDEGHILVGGFKGRGLGRARLVDRRVTGVDASDRDALRRYILDSTLDPIDEEKTDAWLAELWADLEGSHA